VTVPGAPARGAVADASSRAGDGGSRSEERPRPPRILAFAYACEPGHGSEPGAGWTWARMLATAGEVTVVTRANNRRAIEAAVPATPERDSMRFVYVDLPPWARTWKRGQRGVRLYYLLWQLAAVRRARRELRDDPFDLVWHLTLANAWLGSLAPLAGAPFVFGPVGGGVGFPWSQLPWRRPRVVAFETARAAGRLAGRHVNPLLRLAGRRADTILVQNEETRRWLPARVRARTVVFPNPVVDSSAPAHPRRDGPPTALFAARLAFWKGADLAVRALAHAPDWTLVVCGRGDEEARLRELAEQVGVAGRVRFDGWLGRDELLERMRCDADVFLFPSRREEAGWVVAEAIAEGLPVVCLDRGGPPSLAGAAATVVPLARSSEATAAGLGAALASSSVPPEAAVRDRARELTFEAQAARVRALVAAIVATPVRSSLARGGSDGGAG
jgi:glycosyltransferase involved in cell wall biosynthesis